MTIKNVIEHIDTVKEKHRQSILTIQNMIIVSSSDENTQALKRLERLFKDFIKDLDTIKIMLTNYK